MLPEVEVRFSTLDVTCLCETATIVHGRSDPTGQPEASVVSLAMVDPIPEGADVGTPVTVIAVLGGTEFPRFAGTITDLGVEWESVDEPRPAIKAAGPLSPMGRKDVGSTPWPQELDGARAARIITLSNAPTDPLRSDPGTVAILARDVDAQPALQLAQKVADDAGGTLWESKDGFVLYADTEHRRAAPVALALDPCVMPLTVSWLKDMDGLVNTIRIAYGAPPAEGENQPEYAATDPTSISAYGEFEASLATSLAAVGDATQRANGIILKQKTPAWILSGIAIDLSLERVDAGMTAELLALEMHDLVSVTGLPAGSPYTAANLWVEGWVEEITGDSWTIALVTSDYCRSAAELRWDDVPPEYPWDTFPDITWDETSCVQPPLPEGSWDDIPATLRWDQIADTITWDTWEL